VIDAVKQAPGVSALGRMKAKSEKKISNAMEEVHKLTQQLADIKAQRQAVELGTDTGAVNNNHIAASVGDTVETARPGEASSEVAALDREIERVTAKIESETQVAERERKAFRKTMEMLSDISAFYAPPVPFKAAAAREHEKARDLKRKERRAIRAALRASMSVSSPGNSSLSLLPKHSSRYELSGGAAEQASDSDDGGVDDREEGYDPSDRNDPDEHLSLRRPGRSVTLQPSRLPRKIGTVCTNSTRMWNDPDVYVHVPRSMPVPYSSAMATDTYLPLSCRAVPSMFARLAGASVRASYFRPGTGVQGDYDQYDVSNAMDTDEVRRQQECRAALGTPTTLDVLFLLDCMTNRYVLPIGSPTDVRIINDKWKFNDEAFRARQEIMKKQKQEKKEDHNEQALITPDPGPASDQGDV